MFEYDAGFDRHPPFAVVVPGTTEEIAACVKAALRAGVAVVPRGAGTGLSGGTIACGGAMVVATSRLRRVLAIDAVGQTALVEPGVPNLQITMAARGASVARHGAPSQNLKMRCQSGAAQPPSRAVSLHTRETRCGARLDPSLARDQGDRPIVRAVNRLKEVES